MDSFNPKVFYRELYEAALLKVRSRLDEPVAPQSATAEAESDASLKIASLRWVSGDQVTTDPDWCAELAQTEVILLSQYQTLPECRLRVVALVRQLETIAPGAPIAVALDHFAPNTQTLLDGYSAGRIHLAQLTNALGILKQQGVRYWQSLLPIFEMALHRKIQLLAADAGANVTDGVKRDKQAHKVIAAWQAKNPHGKVIALVGEQRLMQGFARHFTSQDKQPLIVVQAWDPLYWHLMEHEPDLLKIFYEGDGSEQSAHGLLQLNRRLYATTHIPPLVKLDSFITWSEAQEAWPGWPPDKVVQQMHGLIERTLKLPPFQGRSADVYCCGDWRLLQRLGELTDAERQALIRQMRLGESYYLPRLNIIYLATLNGYHLGEELGHSLRLMQVGPQSLEWRGESLSASESVYLIAVNEAAGYLASKLVAPGRKPGKQSLRLCRKLATARLDEKLKRWDEQKIYKTAHLAGYGLGEMLYRSVQRRGVRLRLPGKGGGDHGGVPFAGFELAPKLDIGAINRIFTRSLTSGDEAKRLFSELYLLVQESQLAPANNLHGKVHWVAIFYFLFFFCPALLWESGRELFLFPQPVLKQWQLDLRWTLGVAMTVVALSYIGQRLFKRFRKFRGELLKMLGPLTMQEGFLLAIFSAVGEEFLFRGVLQAELGLLPAAILFAAVHFIPDRRFALWPLFALLVGLLLGVSYAKTGNLLVPILAHFLINWINILWMTRRAARL